MNSNMDNTPAEIPVFNWVDEPIKISVRSTTYYVNKKTNTVGCRLFFVIKGPESVINVIDKFADVDCYEVIAEAHLNPQDEFNYEIGKKVARAKAESMAYKRVSNLFVRMSEKLFNVHCSFMQFIEKATGVIEHNDKYLAKF